MKYNRDIMRSILFVTGGTVILGLLMLLVFGLIGFFTRAALLGAVIGCFFAALNFILLAWTLQRAVDSGGSGKGITGISYTLRNLMMLLVAILSIAFLKVHPLALLLPYVFPRLVIAVMQVTGLYGTKDDRLTGGGN